jgi:hypothetical protein
MADAVSPGPSQTKKTYTRPANIQVIAWTLRPCDIVAAMNREVLPAARAILMVGLLWMTGCASGPFANIRKFTPSLLTSGDTDAVRQFKAKAGGDRLGEGRVIQAFLPHAMDRRTLAIDVQKVHYRLGREQLERMLGAPDAVETGRATEEKKAGWHRTDFLLLEYKLTVETPLNLGNHLLVTFYKGYVVDSAITGVITY